MKLLILDWLTSHIPHILATFAVITTYLLLLRISGPKIEQQADKAHFKEASTDKAIRLSRGIFSFVGVLLLLIIWGVDLRHVLILATTTITLLGVALFASWSLLSNITAYFVLLLHPAFKRGSFVRIIDADNYVEGYIAELTLFNTQLITEDREIILYPNNLFLGRPAMVNPRDRLNGIGKIEKATDKLSNLP